MNCYKVHTNYGPGGQKMIPPLDFTGFTLGFIEKLTFYIMLNLSATFMDIIHVKTK